MLPSANILTFWTGSNVTRFFEPVEQRVTLSTNAGVLKPARHFFETALRRAGGNVTLEESAFITESASHIRACRDMGMTCLQFGTDFDDWLEAPLLVSRLISAPDTDNLEAALRPILAGKHDLRLESIETVKKASVRARARKLVPLEASDLGSLKGVYVDLPVDVDARIDAKGRLDVSVSPPSSEDIAEATDNVRTLVSNRQIAADAGQARDPQVLPTHRVETDARGRRLLVRRRFTAV